MDRNNQGSSETVVFDSQAVNILSTMNAFCSEHPGLRLEYVSVDPTQDYVFKCVNCISEENVPQSSLIPINLILSSNDKTIFTNFPITDRSLVIELRGLANDPTNSVQLITKIQNFFKEFRANLLHKIEIIEQKMTEKAKSVSNFGQIFQQYNQICKKNELKEIVNDREKDLSVKSSEIKEICQEVLSKESEHKSSIRAALENIKTLQSAIDFETPNKITELICSQVDKINMFLVEDFQDLQKLIERKSTNKDQNISNLMKLVSNKFNGVSIESCERLKEQLNQISFAFSTLQVPEIGIVGTYLESLNEDSSQAVQQLIEDLSKNQQANEVEEIVDLEKLVAGDLVKLIGNKANFCSNEYTGDVTRVINTLEKVLGLFKVRPPRIQIEKYSAFNSLSEKQLCNLAELAIKTNQISQLHTDSYLNSQAPLPQIQENSNLIWKLIGQPKNIHYVTNDNNSVSDSLDKILVTYPIFDLLPPISNKLKIIPIPISFTKTNFEKSQEIQITQIDKSVQFSLGHKKRGQVVSDILDNQLGYLLKLKFNRSIVDVQSGFWIGLIPNSFIHSTYVLSDKSNSGFVNNSKHGANIIVKGGLLSNPEVLGQVQDLEFRFCIAKQLFLFADSSYSNINKVENTKFDPSQQYRFGVNFNGASTRPADIFVSISEFGTIDPARIEEFE